MEFCRRQALHYRFLCRLVQPLQDCSTHFGEPGRGISRKLDIYKIDTEKEQELASMFNIRSIPSILFVPKDGKPQMSMGALPKENFVQAIQDVLHVYDQPL